MMPEPLWNIPNLLSLSRLPLAAGLFVAIGLESWPLSLIIFAIAMLTDWLDGWWARKFHQQSAIGRSLDPLTDKVLIGGAFIFLIRVPDSAMDPWMVTLVIGRELLITGIRGMVEATGKRFGADWFGKLKTILQTAVLLIFFTLQTLRSLAWLPSLHDLLQWLYWISLGLMLFATVGSGLQYLVKAVHLLQMPDEEKP